MSDRTLFTDDEWEAICEAPLMISMAMTAVGPHGPISMTKESFASAKAIARPGDHGAANALIAEIVETSKSKEARHDAKHDVKDHQASTIPAIVDGLLSELFPAATALQKLPDDEARGVKQWLTTIAPAIAEAAKGTSPQEQAVVDRIDAIFA